MTYNLTNNEVRNDIRGMLRRNPGFDAFRAANGNFASRDFSNDLIHKAIALFGAEAETQAIIDRYAARATGAVMVEPIEDENGETSTPSLAEPVLDVLRPFVSSTLLATVETALAPLVELALKPAVEIEKIVEIEVPVSGSGSGASGSRMLPKRAPAARRDKQTTLGKMFGIRGSLASFPMTAWSAPDAAKIDPMYVVDPVNMAQLATAAEHGGSVWLAGPAGGGKSTMPEQFAANAGRPFVCIPFQKQAEAVELIGQPMPDGNGGMVWCDGILTQAIRQPGTVIMFDEITLAPPGMAAVLQTLMSARVLYIHSTGERVPVADGVVFAACDNTRGYGDDTGLYSGTMQANAALVDRMERMIYVDYLPLDLETQALANRTGAPLPACERVVSFIGGVRKLAGFENRPMSLRRMIAFVKATRHGFNADTAFEMTMLSRLPDAEREALRAHIKMAFDKGAYQAELDGQPVPAPAPAPMPGSPFTPVE